MQINMYCEILFKDNKTPCFVADNDTDVIIYLNDMMKSLLKSNENVIGKRFYDIIKDKQYDNDLNFKFPFRDENGLTFGQYFELTLFDSNLNEELLAMHLQLEYKDKKYNLCQYKPANSLTVSNNFDYAISECMNILNQEDSTILPSLLNFLKSYYNGERSYLYKIDYKNEEIESYDSKVADTTDFVTKKISTKTSIPVLFEWLETRNNAGIIEANLQHTTSNLDIIGNEILTTFGIENMVVSTIEDNDGNVVAVIGLGNKKNNNKDYRLLQFIAQLVSQRIAKNDDKNLATIQDIDVLTGFYNRSVYSNKIDILNTQKLKSLGVIFVNVNGLKKVNTEYGYAKGDNYIKQSAEVLKAYFPNNEIYRISGDEFVSFFENIEKIVFENKIKDLHQNLKNDDNYLFALGSAWKDGSIDVLSLVEESDNLMYINKQQYYHSTNSGFENINDSILSDLLSYLANDEFMVYLQPQIELNTNEIIGAEALIRRFDKTNQKMVFPDLFIPLYEQKSVIRHIDLFVVKQICKHIYDWLQLGKEITIAVNLSRVTLMEFDIVNTITKICDKYNVPHKLLIIEVTERVGLIENDVATTLIDEFKENGFKVSLDDFGCAYSNIVTLANITVDEVKIDKSLVDNILVNPKNELIVRNVISMCNEIKGTHTLTGVS